MSVFFLALLCLVHTGFAQEFQCPHEDGFYPHASSCDKYWKCEAGVPQLKLCANGLAFADTDPDYLAESCEYLHLVDCGSRTEIGLAQEGDYEYEYDYTDEDGNFRCPEEDGFYPHPEQCDRYYRCEFGVATPKLCSNGLAFDSTYVSRENCDYLFAVDCRRRPKLEPPISTPNCPRLYGIFPDESECAIFYTCWNGVANKYQCPPGLAYDRKMRVCVWADKVPECKQQQPYACPAPGEVAARGTFSRHAHPDDCREYFVCIDGVARQYGCPIGMVFQIGENDLGGQCAFPKDVPGCEDYYGDVDLEHLSQADLVLGRHIAKGAKDNTSRQRQAAPSQ